MKPSDSGEELSIWDTNESEFTSGLGYSEVFRCASSSLLGSCMLTPAQRAHLGAFVDPHSRQDACSRRRPFFPHSHRLQKASPLLLTLISMVYSVFCITMVVRRDPSMQSYRLLTLAQHHSVSNHVTRMVFVRQSHRIHH